MTRNEMASRTASKWAFSWTPTRFLKDTEVLYREGAAEKAVEWGQSRDQEGEDQLGDS